MTHRRLGIAALTVTAIVLLLWHRANIPSAAPVQQDRAHASDASEIIAHVPSVFIDPEAKSIPPLAHEFEVANPSPDQAMHLTLLQRSCGCTVADVLTESIPPKGVGRVAIKVNIDKTSRNHRESVKFSTGINSPKTILLTIEGSVYEQLSVEFAEDPVRVTMGESNRCEFVITARHLSSEPRREFTVVLEPSKVPAKLSPPTESEASGIRKVIARGEVDLDVPLVASTAPRYQLRANYGSIQSIQPIPISQRTSISSSPSTVFLRRLPSGESRAEFQIRSGSPIQITNFEFSNSCLQIERASETASTLHKLTLVGTPDPNPKKAKREWVRLTTDHPKYPTVTIPVFILDTPPVTPEKSGSTSQ